MPPKSSIQTFIDAVNTGQTNTTRALEVIGTNLAAYSGFAAALATPGALKADPSTGLLPAWAGAVLSGVGVGALALTPAELLHIGAWPDAEKEKVRAALYQAMQAGNAVHFSWQLYPGADSISHVDNLPGGDFKVTFLSPQSKVRVKVVPGQPDDYTVDVP